MGVVATHSGKLALGGGTWLLFVLIGYNMARFKSKDIVEGNIWQWLKTYIPVILAAYYFILALHFGWTRSFEIDEILLYTNLVRYYITLLFPFWFVQVLIQCLILFGIMFSVPSLQRSASKSPVYFSFAVLAGLVAVKAIYPLFWHTGYLNDLVPLRFLAILWLGWCFYFAERFPHKLLLCAIGIVIAFLDTATLRGFAFTKVGLEDTFKWLVLGSVFLAFVPRVPIPSVTKKIFNDIGAATFYIFVFNGLIIKLLGQAFHIESQLIVFCITMVVSMLIWWGMERLRLISRMQAIFNAKAKN